MNTPSPDRIDKLSSDLIPFFGDPKTSMLVLRVIDVKMGTQTNTEGLELELGTVNLEVLEVLHSSTRKRGDAIEVMFKRFASIPIRVRNNFDMWNAIDLTQGSTWLMAGKVTNTPNSMMGLAARKIDSVNSPEVNAARQCYEIEETKDPHKKQSLLENALTSPVDLLRLYAVDQLGRRKLYDRLTGAEMIAQAIKTGDNTPDNKLSLGYYLTSLDFFAGELKDDGANQIIVAVLAFKLIHETDPERRMEWMNYLASCILGELSLKENEDRLMRSALIRAVKTPTPEEVISALDVLARQADATTKARITELQTAWRATM